MGGPLFILLKLLTQYCSRSTRFYFSNIVYNITYKNFRGGHKNRLRKQPSFFAASPSGISRQGCLQFTTENATLMMQIWPLTLIGSIGNYA